MAKAMSSPVMSSTLHESSQMVSVMASSSDAGAVADAGVAVDAGAAGIHAGCSGWFSAKLSPRIARTQLAAGKSLVPMP